MGLDMNEARNAYYTVQTLFFQLFRENFMEKPSMLRAVAETIESVVL